MQNTTIMFKQMRNLTREKKFSEKIKIIHFANVVTKIMHIQQFSHDKVGHALGIYYS